MTERIFFILIIHVLAALLLENIPHVHSKDCLISRNNRDLLTVFVNQTSCAPSNNPCYKFGGILLLTNTGSRCVCICPASKPTYVENTNRCSAYKDVWSKCNLSFRRQLSAIAIFSTVFSTSLRLNIPKKFRSCKMEADRKNSFYLSGSGWNEVPQKYKFPFLVETRTIRKRLKLTYVKWKTKVPPELVGRVFRLGITCGKQSDCVTLKISGKAFDQCILPPTTMIPASSRPSSFIPSERTTPTKYVITTVQHVIPSTYTQPSVSNNGRRESSSSVKIPWSVIGTVIGLLVVLLLCIVILAVCFWRRRKKSIQKIQNGNASTQSSGMTLSTSGSQPEVTYASPHHHPYQELKPPISGNPCGTYQPLMRNTKEDSSGYMLPSESTANNPDPLYNEIGSPLRSTLPPIYDYALPEDTVRISQHLSNNTDLKLNKLPKHNTRNDADYVGRTTQDQEDSESPSLEGAALAPLGDELVSPSYLDFTCKEAPNQKEPSKRINSDSKAPKQAPGSSRYKKPVNVPKSPRKPVSAPKSPFKKSSPQEFTYQVLTSPSTPACEPLRLRENPENGYNKDSTA